MLPRRHVTMLPTLGMISGQSGRLSPPSLWVVPLFMHEGRRGWTPVEDAYVVDIVPFHSIKCTEDMAGPTKRLLLSEEHRRACLTAANGRHDGYTAVWLTATRFGAKMQGAKPRAEDDDTTAERRLQTLAAIYGEHHPSRPGRCLWAIRKRLVAKEYTCSDPVSRPSYKQRNCAIELVKLHVLGDILTDGRRLRSNTATIIGCALVRED